MALRRIYEITTLNSLRRALGRLSTIKRSTAKIQRNSNKQIARIKKRTARQIKPLQEEREVLLGAIWRYVIRHAAAVFRGRQEATFPSTALTQRPSTTTEVVDEELAIKGLKELGAGYAIQVKESVAINVLNSHPELYEKLEKLYPGAINRQRHLNLTINFLPRGKDDVLAPTLVPEKHKELLSGSEVD